MYPNKESGLGAKMATALFDNVMFSNPTTGRVFIVGAASLALISEVKAIYGNHYSDGTPVVYTTLALAIAQCVASRGDIIIVLPGHTETISSATALAFNVAGITIIGIGNGALKPTFTLDTAATARIAVSVANVTVKNIKFVANFADIATVFLLTTAQGFVVDSCEFLDTSSSFNFLAIITTTVAVVADNLTFTKNTIIGLGTTAATTPIKILGTHNRLTINDNYINLAILNNTSAVLAHAALVVTNLQMYRNRVFRPNTDTATGGILITTSSTTNTGIVADNYVFHSDVAAAILVTAGSIYGMFNNLAIGDADASGYVLPAIGVN
jgi:hypothetical protein